MKTNMVGTQRFMVVTPILLDKNESELIKSKVAKLADGVAEIDFSCDPQILGGLKIVMGSKIIDLTISGYLQKMKDQLTNA